MSFYLIAAHVRVAHEVQHEVVAAHFGGCLEGKLDCGVALEGDPLDCQQGIGLGVSHNKPPLLLLLGGEPKGGLMSAISLGL